MKTLTLLVLLFVASQSFADGMVRNPIAPLPLPPTVQKAASGRALPPPLPPLGSYSSAQVPQAIAAPVLNVSGLRYVGKAGDWALLRNNGTTSRVKTGDPLFLDNQEYTLTVKPGWIELRKKGESELLQTIPYGAGQ